MRQIHINKYLSTVSVPQYAACQNMQLYSHAVSVEGIDSSWHPRVSVSISDPAKIKARADWVPSPDTDYTCNNVFVRLSVQDMTEGEKRLINGLSSVSSRIPLRPSYKVRYAFCGCLSLKSFDVPDQDINV